MSALAIAFVLASLISLPTFTDVSDSLNPALFRSSVGAAFGDYDGDSDLDIFVVNLGQANVLHENNGQGAFEDVAPTLGLDDPGDGVGCIFADFDNDGHLDLFVTNRPGANRLYHNQGDGTFEEVGSTAGVADPSQSGEGAVFGDYDRDGLVDLYVLNYGGQNRLYRNLGDETFEDVATTAGVANADDGEGGTFADYDNDGDLDLFVCNANGMDALYRNEGDGTFEDVTTETGVGFYGTSLGCAFADYDNDGDFDLYVGRWGSNFLFENQGDGTFEETAGNAGVAGGSEISLGVTFGDFDRDGWLDLYVANEGVEDVLYHNQGDGTFLDVTGEVGISNPASGRGAVWGDYDSDGDLDLFVPNHYGMQDKLYRNEGASNHWLHVRTVGITSNREGIGARLTAFAPGFSLVREVSGGGGFASQNSLPVEFGLGNCTDVDSLVIRWPSGARDAFYDLPIDTFLTVEEGSIAVYEEFIDLVTEPMIRVWPNPSAGIQRIEMAGPNVTIEPLCIYDLRGRLVRRIEPIWTLRFKAFWEFDGLDGMGDRLPQGAYLLNSSGCVRWIIRLESK
jgi:hypothetical protein